LTPRNQIMDPNTNKKKFKEKLNDTYRLHIVDVEDLKEVSRYQFTMRKLYTIIITGMLVFSFLLISLVAFTPLKRLMPGYGDIEENSKFIELRKKIDVLENEIETQITYTKGLQNMLAGNSPGEVPISLGTSENTIGSGDKTTRNTISETEIIESSITQSLDRQYFVAPVIGSISAGFDISTNHLGVDILAAKNTPIKAISAGVVISSDFNLDTGNTISIQHQNNIISVYKHNSALLKKSGEKVNAGEAIAIIGNTGTLTDGPHLHLELWYDGTPVNPENFLSFD